MKHEFKVKSEDTAAVSAVSEGRERNGKKSKASASAADSGAIMPEETSDTKVEATEYSEENTVTAVIEGKEQETMSKTAADALEKSADKGEKTPFTKFEPQDKLGETVTASTTGEGKEREMKKEIVSATVGDSCDAIPEDISDTTCEEKETGAKSETIFDAMGESGMSPGEEMLSTKLESEEISDKTAISSADREETGVNSGHNLSNAVENSESTAGEREMEIDRSDIFKPRKVAERETRMPINDSETCTCDDVFHLVTMKEEETESGLLTKPVLQQSEVLRIANCLAPEHITSKSDLTKLVLRQLDSCQIQVIGLYGDDESIVRFLHSQYDFSEAVLCLASNHRKYKRGLYALVAKPNILFIAFLRRKVRNSGKDKSCTRFLRYLRELCDEIHVVLKPEQLKEMALVNDVNTDLVSRKDTGRIRRTVRLSAKYLRKVQSKDIDCCLGFQCAIPDSVATSSRAMSNVVYSSGHDGFAIYNSENRTFFRLEVPRFEESASAADPTSVATPVIALYDKIKLNESDFVLSFNYVSSEQEKHILVITRNKTTDELCVYGGRLHSPRYPIRKFRSVAPLVFSFGKERRLAWYDPSSAEIKSFSISKDYREMTGTATFSVVQADKDHSIRFMEFVTNTWILCVESSSQLFIADIAKGEKLKVLGCILHRGIIDVCVVSNTSLASEIVCLNKKGNNVAAHVYHRDVTNLQELKKIQLGNFSRCSPKLVRIHNQCHVMGTDITFRQLRSAKLTFHMQQGKAESEREIKDHLKILEQFEKIFEDYSVKHCFEDNVRPLHLSFPVEGMPDSLLLRLKSNLSTLVSAYLRRIQNSYHKPVKELSLSVQAIPMEQATQFLKSIRKTTLGAWLRQLIPTVPIQIARVETGALLPMSKEGKPVKHDDRLTPAEIVPKISFGLAEALFADAAAAGLPIKVVSAQGKQSIGKSFFLNHLAGAHFDTSGWRCTEGIWMCAKLLSDFLLVLFDFEGRGTEERSPQEDCLLTCFGAAVSNVVVIKHEPRFERGDTFLFTALEEAAQRLSATSTRVDCLFNAVLCIVIRDVAKDEDEVMGEMQSKLETNVSSAIRAISAKSTPYLEHSKQLSQGIFEDCQIVCQAPLKHEEFDMALQDVKELLRDQLPFSIPYQQMLFTIKSVLASLSVGGVVNVDETSYFYFENRVRSYMMMAVQWGALIVEDDNVLQPLTSLSEVELVEVEDTFNNKACLNTKDAGLQLCTWVVNSSSIVSDETASASVTVPEELVMCLLQKFYSATRSLNRSNDAAWVKQLETFLASLVERRIERVKEWITLSLPLDDTLSEYLQSKKQQLFDYCKIKSFDPLRKKWKLCKGKCQQRAKADVFCERRCIQLSDICCSGDGKASLNCTCMQRDHLCEFSCTYCGMGRECRNLSPLRCGLGANHKGSHDCKERQHLCIEICCKFTNSVGCAEHCGYRLTDDHTVHCCNSEHYCKKNCEAPNCFEMCRLLLDHDSSSTAKHWHDCKSSECLLKCSTFGCQEQCKTQNHFHANQRHFCGQQMHLCRGVECSMYGGRCSDNSPDVKAPCALEIHEDQLEHDGPHYCNQNHLCEEQCPCGCREYCVIVIHNPKDRVNEKTELCRQHDGPCETTQHTFSNRGKCEFETLLAAIAEDIEEVVQTGIQCKHPSNLRSLDYLRLSKDDTPVVVDSMMCTAEGLADVDDSGLILCQWKVDNDSRQQHITAFEQNELIKYFKKNISRFEREGNDMSWTESLQGFFTFVLQRRESRVIEWIEINFPNRNRLSSQLVRTLDKYIELCRERFLSPLRKLWKLCGSRCQQRSGNSEVCQRRCVQLACLCCETEESGCQKCDCFESDHRCKEQCEFCKRSTRAERANPQRCILGAEHSRNLKHKCGSLKHNCPENCAMIGAGNCQGRCNRGIEDHHDEHYCGAGDNHKCVQPCDAKCGKICALPFRHNETAHNEVHNCTDPKCVSTCSVPGCSRVCYDDHFHAFRKTSTLHFCDKSEHNCSTNTCSVDQGRCFVDQGKSAAQCVLKIKSNSLHHFGKHFCGMPHFCNESCPCCGRVCTLKLNQGHDFAGHVCFEAHFGFCKNDDHPFAGTVVIGLDKILNKVSHNVEAILQSGTAAGAVSCSANVQSEEKPGGFSTSTGPDMVTTVDAGIQICTWISGSVTVTKAQASSLVSRYMEINPINDVDQAVWKTQLKTFFENVIDRRVKCVTEWIHDQFPTPDRLNESVTSAINALISTFDAKAFRALRQLWTICNGTCSRSHRKGYKCQRNCLMIQNLCCKSLEFVCSKCNCLQEDHRCSFNCTMCERNVGTSKQIGRCIHGACHSEAEHACGQEFHPCPGFCHQIQARNCQQTCSAALEVDHPYHLCSTGEDHTCPENCSAKGCRGECQLRFRHDKRLRSLHNCGTSGCQQQCSVAECSFKCSSTDHFHAPKTGFHKCSKLYHKCTAACSVSKGRCLDDCNEAEKITCTVKDLKCLSDGLPHYCGKIHVCSRQCSCCDAYCTLPLKQRIRGNEITFTDHDGLCRTHTHGKARSLKVENCHGGNTSSTSGQWCSHVCEYLGRGHVHLVPCQSSSGHCTGRHRQTGGPNGRIVEDEVSHKQFWDFYARFEDPTTDRDQVRLFDLCPAYCGSVPEVTLQKDSISFCSGQLWHAAIKAIPSHQTGHISTNGHLFGCSHKKHIILVIDRSGSMDSVDGECSSRLQRVGKACNDFLSHICQTGQSHFASLITFNTTANIGVKNQGIASAASSVATYFGRLSPDGGTNFCPALISAAQVIQTQTNSGIEPALFFLSDGRAHDHASQIVAEVGKLREHYNTTVSTCLFGVSDRTAASLLASMAEYGGGQFYTAPSGQVLLKSLIDFEERFKETKVVSGY